MALQRDFFIDERKHGLAVVTECEFYEVIAVEGRNRSFCPNIFKCVVLGVERLVLAVEVLVDLLHDERSEGLYFLEFLA